MKRLLLPLLLTATALAQGPLVPPSTSGPQVGPVAPLDGSGNPQATMKTLYQVEPRTPVQTLAVSPPYTISQPGSYYLTGNITVASGDAVVIASDDVTLDLNGYVLKSTFTGGSSGTAISVLGNRSRLTIRNGSIVSSTVVPAIGSPIFAGFGYGIYSDGIISQALVSDLHLSGIATTGVFLDSQGVVERCTIANCGDLGLVGEVIRDCSATNCYNTSINAQANATNCSGASVNGYGLLVGLNALNCSGSSANGTGLYAGRGATNCSGATLSNSVNIRGLWTDGTATSCNGKYPGGGSSAVGLQAAIAIGCTFTAGSNGLIVPLGKSFNM